MPTRDADMMDLLEEIRRGEAKHGVGYCSLHEAYAVLLEEVDELKAETWKRENLRSPHAIRMEALQIAAIALRIAEHFGPVDRT